MSRKLIDTLMKNDKKGVFKQEPAPLIGYTTGFPVIDYANGYVVNVPDLKNPGKIADRWVNSGFFSGQFIMFIGNAGTGKTSFAIAAGSNIVRPFNEGLFIHIDGEHSSSLQRVMAVNGWDITEMEDKYKMMELDYVEDVYELIVKLSEIKLSDPIYRYDTGHLDEFGRKIFALQPTVILIDSLPSLQTKESLDKSGNIKSEMEGQTYNMRLAIAYNSFYKKLRPVIHRANIIVFAINHIKDKPEVGFNKTQAKIQYLKTSESIPGGSGPIYLSQTLLRFIYKGKLDLKDDGFDGYLVSVQSVKSKTNRSDRTVQLVFNYDTGFSKWLTMLKLAKDVGLIQGRNPYCYFKSAPDFKFSTKDVATIETNETLHELIVRETTPILSYMLTDTNRPENDPNKEMNMANFTNMLDESYDKLTDVEQDVKAEF